MDRLDGLSYRQIKAFLTTAKYENFTKAAEELHMTQASVSRNIAALEEQVGIILFVRFKSRARLTDAGVLLAKDLATVLKQMDNAFDKALELQECRYNTLRIGDFDTTSEEMYLFPIVEQFEKKNPHVEVNIERNTPLDIIDGINKHLFDVAFVSSVFESLIDFSDYSSIKIKEFPPCIIISKRHTLFNKKELTYQDFLDNKIITLGEKEYSGYSETVNQVIKQYGFNPANKVIAKNPRNISIDLKRGDCIAILDEYYTPGRREDFRYIPLEGSKVRCSFNLVYNESSNPNVKSFVTCAKKADL